MTRKRLLIVDDSSFSRELLRGNFCDDFEIFEASDGEMALSVLRENKVDVLLLDIEMPKLDGISVLREIRNDEALNALPVIVISNYDGYKREIDCFNAGADDVIRKPFDIEALKVRINNIMMLRSAKHIDTIRSRMETVLNNVPCGIIRLKHHKELSFDTCEIMFVNNEYYKLRNLDPNNLPYNELIHGMYIDEEDFKVTMACIKEAVKQGRDCVSYSYRLRIGEELKYIDSKVTITNMDEYLYLDAVECDVTEQRKISRQIEIDQKKYTDDDHHILAQAIEYIPNGAVLLKMAYDELEIVGVNDYMLKYLGYERNEFFTLFGKEFLDLDVQYGNGDTFRKDVMTMILTGKDVNTPLRIRKANGELKWINVRVSVLERYADVCIGCAVVMEIDELKEKADRDQLTGLLNRHSFKELVDADINNTQSKDTRALIMIDIDNFKEINDTYGHAYGDNTLVQVADKIRAVFREDDYIARIGGDEFCIYIKNASKRDVILTRAIKTCEELQMTFAEEGKKVDISCSMGVVFISDLNTSYDEVFNFADTAQYSAKKNGKNSFVVWDNKQNK